MFNCQHCGNTVPAHTPAQKVVTQTREKVYAGHEEVYPPLKKPAQAVVLKKRQLYGQPNSKAKKDFWHDAPSGVGQEIVRELLVCPACAERLRPTASNSLKSGKAPHFSPSPAATYESLRK